MIDSVRQLFDFFGGGEPVERTAEEQRRVDQATAGWSLYHYDGCLFCSRVRRAIDRLALDIELRNVLEDPRHRYDLIEGGGRSTVPCLRVPGEGDGADRWMYESADIVAFLEQRFGP